MKALATGWAIWLAALLLPGPAVAELPDLDIPETAAGEAELEVDAWRGDDMWLVRPELSLGLTDRIAFQIQTDFGREGGRRTRIRDLSLQAVIAQAKTSPFGLAAEAGVDPSHGELRGEVFLFGSHEAGAWRVDGNLGLEQESREASLVYAWRVQRTLGLRWAAAVEGGGGGGFGGEREHFAGATLSTELEKPAIELRLGWLFDLRGGAHLTRVGFALPLWDPRRSAAQSLARERDRG